MNAMMALFIKLKNKNVYINSNNKDNNDKKKQNSKNQPNFDEYEQQ